MASSPLNFIIMALRDQPYLPLYVQDFLTDEKLAECSAEATGVYIRLMCLMHKSEDYGKITLKEKDFCRNICRGKISGNNSGDLVFFAEKFVKHLPYTFDVILRSLEELTEERVLYLDGRSLCQKRMIKDAEISAKRSNSGKKGADATNHKLKKEEVLTPKKKKNIDKDFAAAKYPANTEYENEYEIHLSSSNNIHNKEIDIKGVQGEKEISEVQIVEADDNFSLFEKWIRETAPNVGKMKEPFTRAQFESLIAEYSVKDIKDILEAMHNYKPLKSKNVSANLTARNWLKRDKRPTLDQMGERPAQMAGKVGNIVDNLQEALTKL